MCYNFTIIMPDNKPTKKQTLLLDFIRDFTAAHGYSPSYREIREGMSLRSISAVAEHVDNCIERGYLKKTPGAARSLEIVDPANKPAYVTEIEQAIAKLELDESRKADIDTLRQALKILESMV